MNNNKISGISIFLGIIGIILLSSLIILPPAFRIFIPRDSDDKKNIEDIDNNINRTISCKKTNDIDSTSENIQFQLYITDGTMDLVAVTKTTSYNGSVEISTDNFENIQKSFNNDKNLFYSYSIEEKRTIESYRVTMDKDIQLPIKVENIDIISSHNDLISTLKNNGYVCR